MSGSRSIDFYFADTEELLESAWIRDSCTVYEFIDCARSLGYLRQDCRLSEVAVVHRSKQLVNGFVLSSADVAPGEAILVVRSGPDVDAKSVYALMGRGLTTPHAMAMLRYTSNNLDEAISYVGRAWHPRMVRDMLVSDRSSLGEIVNLIGCDNRRCAEHFLGSLLLNPACFERELASIAFERCVKDRYDGGPMFHTFSLLLRIYHQRDCPFCSGSIFSEHEKSRAHNHHMNGISILRSLEIGKLEQVKDASREFRISIDAGFCLSLVLYAWCLEILGDRRDDCEIRLCLNAVDRATCRLDDDKYVHRLYLTLRKRHGKDKSDGLVFDSNQDLWQQACIIASWGLEDMGLTFRVKRTAMIQEYLITAASAGDSWAQQAIQYIRSIGRIPDNFVHDHLDESLDRISALVTAHENEPRGTGNSIPDELIDSTSKAEPKEALDLNMWQEESLTQDSFAMGIYGLCLLHGYGLCLLHGYGCKSNVVRGLRYLRMSAEQGDAQAQYNYAVTLLQGQFVRQNLEEAVRYFKMSADQGYAYAQYNYALCVSKGEGVPRNLEESARYFKMSADQGHAEAQFNYALLVWEGQGVCRNLEEAVRYLKMSADQGNAQAQCSYALHLFHGDGVSPNIEESARYFQLSADQGCAEAQYNYAGCLLKGWGVSPNLEEAARYYKMSADQGDAEAQYHYALFLSEGRGVCRNLKESARYYKMSADQGNAKAQYQYAMCLLEGRGVCVNVEEAARYLKMSADQGYAKAQDCYARHLLNGDGLTGNFEESARYFKMSADQGHAEAQYSYAVHLLTGKGVCRNLEEAARYFKMSADQGCAEAQSNYAVLLLEGRGVSRNLEEAARYFKMSADQGNAQGQCNYALCVSKGEGVFRNLEEAARYFKMSADQGDAQAQNNYALRLLRGEGVSQNLEEAVRYFKMSCVF